MRGFEMIVKYTSPTNVLVMMDDGTALSGKYENVVQKVRDPETDNLTGETIEVGTDTFSQTILDWVNAGNTIEPYVAPLPDVPVSISDRQFAQQLATAGMITKDEALAWVATGTLPEAFTAFVNQLPTAQRFAAQMLLTGATIFERANPLTDAFGAMYGMNSEQIDDLWRAASQL